MGHLGMDQDPPIGNLLVGRTTHFCIVGFSCLNHANLGLSSYVFNFCLNHLEESSTSLFRVLMRDHWEMPRCQFQPSHPPFSMVKTRTITFFAIDFLVGGLEHDRIIFSIQLGMSSSQLTNSMIFQRGCFTTNQFYNFVNTLPSWVQYQKAQLVDVRIALANGGFISDDLGILNRTKQGMIQ